MVVLRRRPQLVLLRPRRGAAAVEMAIVSMLFFLLVFGIIEFSNLFMVYQTATNAAREGARFAVVQDRDVANLPIKVYGRVANRLRDAGFDPQNIVSINVSPPSLVAASEGEPVTVSLVYNYQMLTGFGQFKFVDQMPIKTQCTMRLE